MSFTHSRAATLPAAIKHRGRPSTYEEGTAMAATRTKRRTGRTIEVERVMSVGRDRRVKVGAVVRLRDERGAMLALRLRPGQVTLASGLGGIVAAWD